MANYPTSNAPPPPGFNPEFYPTDGTPPITYPPSPPVDFPSSKRVHPSDYALSANYRSLTVEYRRAYSQSAPMTNPTDGALPITSPPSSGPGYPLPTREEYPHSYSPTFYNGPPIEKRKTNGDGLRERPVLHSPSHSGYPSPTREEYPSSYSPTLHSKTSVMKSSTSDHQLREAPVFHPQPAADSPRVLGLSPLQTYSQTGMQPLSACPPGLEYLTMVDQLLVHQKIEMLEVLYGFETNNEYDIKNSMGQMIYTAKEDSDCCSRNCLGSIRGFDMKIKDNAGIEVIHLSRPCRCNVCCCCFPCCLQELEVMSPPGTVIGTVVEECTFCYPRFLVKNVVGETVLHIKGPLIRMSFRRDIKFKIFSKDGKTEIGCISKQWCGIVQELYTDADNFGITFPIDLDVTMKAVLLGACMLIDFMFFEDNQQQKS